MSRNRAWSTKATVAGMMTRPHPLDVRRASVFAATRLSARVCVQEGSSARTSGCPRVVEWNLLGHPKRFETDTEPLLLYADE